MLHRVPNGLGSLPTPLCGSKPNPLIIIRSRTTPVPRTHRNRQYISHFYRHDTRCCFTIAAAAAGDHDSAAPSSPSGANPGASQTPSSNTTDAAPIGEDAVSPSSSQPEESTSTLSREKAPLPTGPVTWRGLLTFAVSKVKTNIWPLLLVHCLCDALIFSLHRISHRFTNELAVNVVGGGALTPAAIGNMWWLTADPAIANFQTGYQYLTILVFLLAFPINVLLKTLASCATILVCSRDVGEEVVPLTPWWRPFTGMRRSLPAVRAVWPEVSSIWPRVFAVELMVSAAVIPLQFASLAVITLPLTLPLLLSLHAAAPTAVLEGKRGWQAIQRSQALVKRIRWSLAVPFVGLVVSQRFAEAAKGHILGAMPPRFYKELVELPAAVLLGGLVLSVLLSRLQDVLPFVAFSEARRKEAEEAALGEGDGHGAAAR